MHRLRTSLLLLLAACAGSRPTPASAPGTGPVATVSASTPTVRAQLRQFIDSLADAPEFRSAHWGLLVVDPARSETLYARNADKLFVPASNQKLITGATALATLGADFRWTTTLWARGAVRNGVLAGDLVVRGNGDPSISVRMRGDALAPLRALADSLRAHGVTRIRGSIVAAPSPFTDAPLGFGWSWDDLDEPYGAGVDALLLNEGFSEILVRGGAREGEAVTATTRPAASYPTLIVRARTGPAQAEPEPGTARRHAIRVGFDSSHAGVLVSGSVAPGDSAVLQLAHRDQRGAYLAALREALRAGGITIHEARTDTTARLDSMLAMRSPPLREVLPHFQKPSQNQIGELLYKSMGLEGTGVGRADSARVVVARQLVAWGAAPDAFAVRDGSGLSRHNFVTPRALIVVLDAMRRHPDFRVFYDALPVAGVDGTIEHRMRGTVAAGNVHAKTGYVDKARSLSGYVTTADGRLLLFSALCNNYSVPTRQVERVQDAIAVRLASLRLPIE